MSPELVFLGLFWLGEILHAQIEEELKTFKVKINYENSI